ncbi:MAG: response regulator transcription factor [Defluviitaleaceae bacterium]|nr:response regulator transcription factor [Defluviitaleaceae bacterium]
MSNLVYIADSDIVVRQIVQAFLQKEGFEVECFATGDALYAAFEQKPCDLVILDLEMHGSDGFIISAKIRQRSSLPIIMLTARESEEDYVFGISLGIDAYLIKPFSPAKLIAHIRALLIKAELGKHMPVKEYFTDLTYGDVSLSPENRTTSCNDKEFGLTNTEFHLLKFMLQNKERAISRGELLNEIWGYDSPVGTRATDDTIKRLRRKLGEAGSLVSIDTVWGFGFRLGMKEA